MTPGRGGSPGSEGELPFIDAHETLVPASPAAVWDALAATLGRMGGPLASPFARLLGCAETQANFPRSVVGFRVIRAERPNLISLAGAHRFSRYRLEFQVHGQAGAGTELRALSWAEFPGAHGRLYRGLVIGTGGHVLAVRRLLAAVKREAVRGGRPC